MCLSQRTDDLFSMLQQMLGLLSLVVLLWMDGKDEGSEGFHENDCRSRALSSGHVTFNGVKI
jgi:hypothetical protein